MIERCQLEIGGINIDHYQLKTDPLFDLLLWVKTNAVRTQLLDPCLLPSYADLEELVNSAEQSLDLIEAYLKQQANKTPNQ